MVVFFIHANVTHIELLAIFWWYITLYVPPKCYFDNNMTVLENHNTVDNTMIVPVNAYYYEVKIVS